MGPEHSAIMLDNWSKVASSAAQRAAPALLVKHFLEENELRACTVSWRCRLLLSKQGQVGIAWQGGPPSAGTRSPQQRQQAFVHDYSL
jgi:hypothetical protein